MATLILKPGREKSLLRRHPWVFSGAVAEMDGDAGSGADVEIRSADGRFLGWAGYSPRSRIVARVWSWDEEEPPGAGLLRERLSSAIEARRALLPQIGALRLVNAESDGLPGVIVDRYADTVVVQLSSAGAMHYRDAIADELVGLTRARSLYERSDAEVLALEGIEARVGLLRGEPLAGTVTVTEHGLRFAVDIAGGHKTGFYLDQRRNRRLVRELAPDADVLDCFSYTGGFALSALAGAAASVTAVESSGEAIALARANACLNNLPEARCEWVEADVFGYLRRLRDQARTFDMVILDPPKFAPTAAAAKQAARGYKDINLLAFKLLRPGGLLLTFSCSGGISSELFRKIVAGAARDAGVDAQILRHLCADVDHPVALSFPEGEYLKGLLCRV
jgi:23S rRNA (cytosine1962-C5)-methyltransferase